MMTLPRLARHLQSAYRTAVRDGRTPTIVVCHPGIERHVRRALRAIDWGSAVEVFPHADCAPEKVFLLSAAAFAAGVWRAESYDAQLTIYPG